MPLPSTGLPTPLADMKDVYGLAEPDDTSSSSKPQKNSAGKAPIGTKDAAATSSKQGKSKLGSLMSSLLGKKDNGSIQSGSNDSQATLTAANVTPEASKEPETKASSE